LGLNGQSWAAFLDKARTYPELRRFCLIILFHIVFVSGLAYCSDQHADAAAHADKGLQFAQAGSLADAEFELRTAVQLAPDNSGFLASLGTVLAMERKLEESADVFKRALKLNSSDLTVRRYLSADLWQLHRYSEARQNLELILKDKPDDNAARLLLGMVSENTKDYATARRMLSSVPAQVREQPESIAALARSYYHFGEKEKARSTLRELQTHTGGAQGILLGAQIADEMQDYQAAERLLISIKSNFPDPAALGYRLALVRYHAKRFDESQRTLLHLIASGYKTSQVFNLLGWCYQKQNQPQQAAQALEESISLAPAEESNYLDLIKMLLVDRLLPAALEVARRATRTLPESVRVSLMRGSVELKMSQFTDAIASYTRAVQLDPGGADGILGLAEAQSAAGMNKEASASFEAAIKRFPKDARFKVQFALMLLKEADTGNSVLETRAEQLLKSALTLDRSLPEAHYQLGDLALKKGRTAEALQDFEQAAKLDPQSAKVHYALSRVYRRLGRTAEASRQADLYRQLKEAELQPSGTSSSAGVSEN